MSLLSQQLRRKLPRLYATEEISDPMVVCRFYLPMSGWTWYATEFDGVDTLFGYVEGAVDSELGYFSLSELEGVTGAFGFKVERDLSFVPIHLSLVKARVKGSYATV